MKTRFPIQVGLMDDDFCALKWNAELLTRDLRTTVRFEAEKPSDLLRAVKSHKDINVILLDVEYNIAELHLSELIESIKSIRQQLAIVCLSQYGELEHLHAAITSGSRGFLLKSEVRMAIVSAIVQALQVNFLVTPGVLSVLQRDGRQITGQLSRINAWSPNPNLTPKLQQILTLKILYGMSSPQVAQEIHLAPATVEKYVQYAYQKLSIQWGDDGYLAGLEIDTLPPEVKAFHRYNLPPRK